MNIATSRTVPLRKVLNFYMDPICPNSWISWKVLKSNDKYELNVIPVYDGKIQLFRYVQAINKLRKEKQWISKGTNHENSNDERIPTEAEFPYQIRPKALYTTSFKHELPSDWAQIHKQCYESKSLLPALYLTSLKEHFPSFLDRSIDVIGHRIWQERQAVHKGVHMATCARLAGLEFRESEFVISRLSHRNYRKQLEDNCKQFLQYQGESAPLVTTADENSNLEVITDVSTLL